VPSGGAVHSINTGHPVAAQYPPLWANSDQSALQQMAGYSITSSAVDIKPDGIVMPSVFAVLKLMTN
jgi:hypothetical protein